MVSLGHCGISLGTGALWDKFGGRGIVGKFWREGHCGISLERGALWDKFGGRGIVG